MSSVPVRFLVVQLLLLVLPCWIEAAPPPIEPSGIYEQPQPLSAAALEAHLRVLASDSLEGRGTGTHGEEMAASYIAAQLREAGLQPTGTDGSFYQAIPMHGSTPIRDCLLEFVKEDGIATAVHGQDYFLFNGGAQTYIPTPIPLIFVGYGIIAPEYDYNDYLNLNVENAIVVFLSDEPLSDDGTYFGGRTRTPYSYPEMKQAIALARGARGSILIPLPRDSRYADWQHVSSDFSTEIITLLYGTPQHLSILINPEAAEHLFADAPYWLDEVLTMDSTSRMRSFPLPVKARFQGRFVERDFISRNVAGLIEGSDPLLKDSYLIISAHYDHLGIGPPVDGDSIYNGAFDNAAGVAAVIEIARSFASEGPPPQRSILFLFTTGEERGWLGSRYYCDHPLVPLHTTIANINVDGIAMFDTFNDIVAVGAELSTLHDHVQHVTTTLGLRISPIPELFETTDPFTRSDQIIFAQAGIPSMLITEGLDYRHQSRDEGLNLFVQWGQAFYHTPFDDLNQPMNFQAAIQHSRVVRDIAAELSSTYIVPQWRPGSPYINARLLSIAKQR